MAPRKAFAFVHEDGCQKPGRRDRILIRSHVMLGKNTRSTLRRSAKETRRDEGRLSSKEAEAVMSANYSRNPVSATDRGLTDKADTPLEKRLIYCGPSYAGNLSVEAQWQLSELMYWKASKQYSMPLKQYLDFGADGMTTERWLYEDDAFTHSCLFSALAYRDYTAKNPLSRETMKHLHLALLHLNRRLSKPNAYLTDQVLHVVNFLAMAAIMMGDNRAAEAHIKGLQRIIHLRGGRQFLSGRPKLYILLNHLDLFWSATTSNKSLLGQDEDLSQTIFTGCLPCKVDDQDDFSVATMLEPHVASIYRDLRFFSRTINEHACSDRPMSAIQAQGWLNDIITRLLCCAYDTTSMSECLRLAMLAYLTTKMRVAGRRLEYKAIAVGLRHCIQANLPTLQEHRDLFTWCLLIGTIAVFEATESWLQALWKSVTLEDEVWEDVLPRVEHFIWLPVIDDTDGRIVFHALKLGSLRVQ